MSMHLSRRQLLAWLGAGGFMPGTLIGLARAQEAKRREIRVIKLRIKSRRVVAPKGAIRVSQNDVVELHWASDERVRLHLHGYDRKLEIRPGEPAKMVVKAQVAGRFPITSHGWGTSGRSHGHDTLTYLEVYPR
jgi:hypothetical protein